MECLTRRLTSLHIAKAHLHSHLDGNEIPTGATESKKDSKPDICVYVIYIYIYYIYILHIYYIYILHIYIYIYYIYIYITYIYYIYIYYIYITYIYYIYILHIYITYIYILHIYICNIHIQDTDNINQQHRNLPAHEHHGTFHFNHGALQLLFNAIVDRTARIQKKMCFSHGGTGESKRQDRSK